MSAEEQAALEERSSRLLAACDDALATRTPLPMPSDGEMPDELLTRLEEEVSWYRMVRCLLSDSPSMEVRSATSASTSQW